MLSLLSEIKFLSSRDDIKIKDTDLAAFKYAEKRTTTTTTTTNHSVVYEDGKQDFAQTRDQKYSLYGKKSKQLKNSIKKLEDSLRLNRIIYCAWNDGCSNVMHMLLSNGLLIHICIDVFTGDINRMAFDRFFIGKLTSETVTDVIMTRTHIIISYDINQLTFVYLQKPNLKKTAPEKISRLDPKIFNIIINGSQAKKISRHLACNLSMEFLAVWTKSSQNEVYPWRPTVRDQDRANIHIYRLNQSKLELVCYYWTENDPISVEFSKMNQNQLRSIENKVSRKREITIEICVYEVSKCSKMQRVSVTSIPLQSQVCCHSFSPDNEKLMLGCIDGSVILFDEGRGITHLIKAAFIPTLVAWHADSAILMIANEKSQIQFFDISLSCIRNQFLNEDMTSLTVTDLSSFFASSQPPTLFAINCSKKPDLTKYSQQNENYIQTDSYVLCLFENGPIALLRLLGGNGHKGDLHTSGFTADILIHQYLKLNIVEKAINILLTLNWDVYGAMLMVGLHKIANFILKQPFQPEREIQLQKALGSFLVPVKQLCEDTHIEFGDQIKDLTRKFFQYLLRNKSYEKAFNLAIDIDDEDLFMDLKNCAKEDGLLDLANDAYQKAEIVIANSDNRHSSHSTCSCESCSVCATHSSADDESESETVEMDKKKLPDRISKYHHKHSGNFPHIQIPKPELKVSHFSKNSVHDRDIYNIPRSKSDNLNTVGNSSHSSPSPYHPIHQNQHHHHHHHVVDVVPKPTRQSSLELNILDQTIGIPITNPAFESNLAKGMHNISLPIIHHHPLVSGTIPASVQFNSVDVHSMMKKKIPPFPQTSNLRKESGGEKNKVNSVKFSNTVTVAVVPDIQRSIDGTSRRSIQDTSTTKSLTWV